MKIYLPVSTDPTLPDDSSTVETLPSCPHPQLMHRLLQPGLVTVRTAADSTPTNTVRALAPFPLSPHFLYQSLHNQHPVNIFLLSSAQQKILWTGSFQQLKSGCFLTVNSL